MREIKLCTISDLHISLDLDHKIDYDNQQNFIDTLRTVSNEKPDIVVVTGDICCLGSDTNIYNWVINLLDKEDFEYFILPGNHDNSVALAFALKMTDKLNGNEFYYSKIIGQYNLMMLDSAVSVMSNSQLKWIANQLEICKENDLEPIMFVHHPPRKTGDLYMDKAYPLKNMFAFNKSISNYKKRINIFTGHYHTNNVRIFKDITIYQTPSTSYQIDGDLNFFNKSTEEIGYRVINLSKEGLDTSVTMLKNNYRTV